MLRPRYGMIALAAVLWPLAGSAQRLLELPVRTEATADAVITGLPAIFWNPAALTVKPYRGAGMVLNVRTPSELGLSGIVGAAAIQTERLTVGVAWEHVSVDDITQTDDSPVDPIGNLSIGEDRFTLAAAHEFRPAFSVGATARYARDDIEGTDATLALGAGVLFALSGPLEARLGAMVLNERDEAGWNAGAEIRLPPWFGEPYRLNLSYGAGEDAHAFGIAHRVAGRLDWEQRAAVSFGMTREPGSDDAEWQPLLAASLRLNRYTVGVARESLSAGFGATYAFRLQIGLGH
ncbi:MAG TPA: hypothetical protein VK864_03595 [Longimicrobiales bacterium]|nr:hypothetical protein [Longimicrobiales bacterium]